MEPVKLVYNDHPWDPQKLMLFRGGRYPKGTPLKLVLFLFLWGSGWSLLTGGGCSKVMDTTGWSVHKTSFTLFKCQSKLKLEVK